MDATAENYYQKYIASIHEDALPALQTSYGTTMAFLETIPARSADYRYAPGKWSVKQLLIHITDAERIYTYRALCIARGETQSLPGFDEDTYANNSYPEEREWEQVVQDFKAARLSSIELFKGFAPTVLQQTGIANGLRVTPALIGKIMAGHCQHHIEVLKERYHL